MRLPLSGHAVLFVGLLSACGAEETAPDWSFNITATTKETLPDGGGCIEVAELIRIPGVSTPGYSDVCGPVEAECANLEWDWEDPDTVKQTMQYDVYFEGANASIKIDGNPFATALSVGCDLNDFETPTWLEEKPDGAVTWKLRGLFLEAGGPGMCDIAGGYDWLGVEEITVVESDNLKYPAGCTYRMAVTGEAIAVEE